MFCQDKSSMVVVNYNIDKTFNAILSATENISDFRITNKNKLTHSISISVKPSLFSYGEDMAVSLKQIEEGKTEIYCSSGSKLGTELVTNIKNRKNIDRLINEMSIFLE